MIVMNAWYKFYVEGLPLDVRLQPVRISGSNEHLLVKRSDNSIEFYVPYSEFVQKAVRIYDFKPKVKV